MHHQYGIFFRCNNWFNFSFLNVNLKFRTFHYIFYCQNIFVEHICPIKIYVNLCIKIFLFNFPTFQIHKILTVIFSFIFCKTPCLELIYGSHPQKLFHSVVAYPFITSFLDFLFFSSFSLVPLSVYFLYANSGSPSCCGTCTSP